MPKYTNNTGSPVSINTTILKAGETKDFPYYIYKEDVDMEEYDETSTIPHNLFENSGLHELDAGEDVSIEIFQQDENDKVIPLTSQMDKVEFYVACDAGEVMIYFNDLDTDFITLEAGQVEYGDLNISNVGKITVEAVADSIVRLYVRSIN